MVLTTWQRGREIVTAQPRRGGGPAARPSSTSCATCDPPVFRAPGTGGLPQRQQRDHAAGAAGERRAQPRAPRVRRDRLGRDAEASRTSPSAERVSVDDLGYRDDGIIHVTARFGFQDDRRPRSSLRLAAGAGSRATSTSTARPTSSRRSRSSPTDGAGHGALAQAAVHRASRATPPARPTTSGCPRPHRRHGLPDRALSAASDADARAPLGHHQAVTDARRLEGLAQLGAALREVPPALEVQRDHRAGIEDLRGLRRALGREGQIGAVEALRDLTPPANSTASSIGPRRSAIVRPTSTGRVVAADVVRRASAALSTKPATGPVTGLAALGAVLRGDGGDGDGSARGAFELDRRPRAPGRSRCRSGARRRWVWSACAPRVAGTRDR